MRLRALSGAAGFPQDARDCLARFWTMQYLSARGWRPFRADVQSGVRESANTRTGFKGVAMEGMAEKGSGIRVWSDREPHSMRGKAMLRAHPELRQLIGRNPATAACIAAVVALQLTVAALVARLPWWEILIAAYLFGAVAALALWTLLHECSHDLVFRKRRHNRMLGIFTGLPLVLPVAASFRKYHRLHHRHQGDPQYDADIASIWESRLVGNRAMRKAVWLLAGPALQSLRAMQMKRVGLWDRDFAFNAIIQIAFDALIVMAFGWGALLYLLASNCFSLGLHPLGGRTIQEHFALVDGQETYSYYGPANLLVFNAGYHVEHHDLVGVPWNRLPRIRVMAPEFHEGLYAHRSWLALTWQFLCDRSITLDRRAIRGDGTQR